MKSLFENIIRTAVGTLILWLVALGLVMPALGQEVKPLPSLTQPARSETVPEQAENKSDPPPLSPLHAVVTGLTLVKLVETAEGIDLVTDGPVADYTAFPMTKPDRLVIDLPGVRNGVGSDKVNLNSFGITSARLVELEGKSRIVFHGRAGVFTLVKVIRTNQGVRLQTVSPGNFTGKSVEEAPAALAAAGIDSHSRVESLDFAIVDTGSRITMKVGGSCLATQPFKNSEGLSFFVKKCLLPRNIRRPLDTRAFPSVVRSVTPYQLSVKGVPETRVLVKLNQPATWSLRQESGTILLDITHPKLAVKTEPEAPVKSQPQPVTPPSSETTIKKLQDSVAAPPGTKKLYTGRKVTLEFVDADIRKIFQLIAEVSNLNMLLGDDVTGVITIKLVNVPWDQALDMILESKGLAMRAEGNIVLVKPQNKFKSSDEEALDAKKSREKMMELKTRVFDVNFAQSSDLVTQFRTLGSGRSDSSITQDERTNKVIVTDIEPAVIRMQKFLESIDIPEKQVLIEARIVEASDSFTHDLGIQWGIHYRDASASILGVNSLNSGFGGAVSSPPTSGTSGPGMATGISFGTLASNISLDLRLSAAVTADLIKIVSTPKIATLNNKAAKITQGQSIPYQNTTANTGAVTQFVEAALSLEVTPHITPDGSVMMKIKASNNSPGAVPTGGTAPAINKKEATTELIVHSGETTVIGGIYIDNDTENNSGVPFLVDIPVLGWLFKSNTKSKLKTELLIFITPRILN